LITAGRSVLVAVSAVLVALAAGCGDDAGGGGDEGSSPVSLVEGVEAAVLAIDNTFRPGELEVAAGTEVVWTNGGRTEHNVLAVDGDAFGVEADAFAPDATYRARFTEPGTYDYYCSLHGTTTKGMVGTIVVTG
jgi:plastocyanin